MTVAEQIKRKTKPLTWDRFLMSLRQSMRGYVKLVAIGSDVSAVEFVFIDGSRLTCRTYVYE